LHSPNFLILSQNKKSQPGIGKSTPPPYLPNGDTLEEFFHTIAFKTLQKGGVGRLQILKKKAQSGQNAHETQKSQISYILQT
jgi:hypothetical protein